MHQRLVRGLGRRASTATKEDRQELDTHTHPLRVRHDLHRNICFVPRNQLWIPTDLPSVYSPNTDLQRETEEKARQPETKLSANAQTRHIAGLRDAKRSRTRSPKPSHGARDRPKQPQPRAGRGRASEPGRRHASRRTRPTDTGTRCHGKGQR
jgi:hypothetical protein